MSTGRIPALLESSDTDDVIVIDHDDDVIVIDHDEDLPPYVANPDLLPGGKDNPILIE